MGLTVSPLGRIPSESLSQNVIVFQEVHPMIKTASWFVVAAACAALFAAPAMAADAPAAKADMAGKKMAMKSKHKFSCYDYAWDSQALKDCLAKPASEQKPMKKSMKKSMKKDATKKS
jgi:hypothetical protein